MPRMRRLATVALLTVAAPTALVVGTSSPAHAISGEITSPSSSTFTSGSSMSVSARYTGLGMSLLVSGPGIGQREVDSGGLLKGRLAGSARTTRNGTYTVTLRGKVTGHVYDTRTFRMRVAPRTPGGMSARLSGSRIKVSWARGSEADLLGYTVSVAGGGSTSGSAGGMCSGSSCGTSLRVPSGYHGTVSVGVRARRSNGSGGSLSSGSASDSVTIKGSSGTGNGTGTSGTAGLGTGGGNSGSNPLNSPFSLPNVGPNGSNPGFQYPQPGPDVAAPAAPQPKAQNVSATSAAQWGKSLAVALVLLLVAAHMGTWTRRFRAAHAAPGRTSEGPAKAAGSGRGLHAKLRSYRGRRRKIINM